MKSIRLHTLRIATLLMCFLSSAFSAEKPPQEPECRHHWKKGDFFITLVIGQQIKSTGDGVIPHSTSYYRISKNTAAPNEERTWQHVYVESALQTFHAGTEPDYIKFHLSDSKKTLLIEEPVPNDCNLVTNYILVTNDSDYMAPVYLDAKNAQGKAFTSDEKMNGSVPSVKSITDATITFSLWEEKDWTLKHDQVIKKIQRPDFPG